MKFLNDSDNTVELSKHEMIVVCFRIDSTLFSSTNFQNRFKIVLQHVYGKPHIDVLQVANPEDI